MMFHRAHASPPATDDPRDWSALAAVIEGLAGAETDEQLIRRCLDAVRAEFGWAYGSYWSVDLERNVLRFTYESGTVDATFAEVTAAATFARGVGVAGRAWQQQALVFVSDLGTVTDCVRAPAARDAGVKSGVCLPVVVDGNVIGTVDFFSLQVITLTAGTTAALRSIATVMGQALERLLDQQSAREQAADSDAVAAVLGHLTRADSEEQAFAVTLDAVRDTFGWAYGSVWRVEADRALHFARDSGTVTPEFHAVTAQASFTEGVGLSGRAWRTRSLFFVSDLAELTDCVRAPAARTAGVKSGVCLPIQVDGDVVATMDFFALQRLELSPNRRRALSLIAEVLGQAVARLRRNDTVRHGAAKLSESISGLAVTAQNASDVAAAAVASATGARDAISVLDDAAGSIGQLAQVISAIAGQTNLLALNATIEAARAGAAGAGFAVVASEVKELARSTAEATNDVAEHIAGIQLAASRVSDDVTAVTDVISTVRTMQVDMAATLNNQAEIAQQFTG